MKRKEWNIIKSAIEKMNGKVKGLKDHIDSIGKVIQTPEGDGTMENPYKGWTVGQKVERGKWYLTNDGYLWEAKKTGYPSSSMDDKYWDIP